MFDPDDDIADADDELETDLLEMSEEEFEAAIHSAFRKGKEAAQRDTVRLARAMCHLNGDGAKFVKALEELTGTFTKRFNEADHPRNHGEFAKKGEGDGEQGVQGGGAAELGDSNDTSHERRGSVSGAPGATVVDADSHARTLAARIAEVPAAVVRRVSEWVKGKYAKLAARYGETGAKAVLGAMVLLLPLPIPGSSLLPVAVAEAVLRVRSSGTEKKGFGPSQSRDERGRWTAQVAGELAAALKQKKGTHRQKAWEEVHEKRGPDVSEHVSRAIGHERYRLARTQPIGLFRKPHLYAELLAALESHANGDIKKSFDPNEKRDESGKWTAAAPLSRLPETEDEAVALATAARDIIIGEGEDDCAVDGDCEMASYVLRSTHPDIEIWHGNYNGEYGHNIVKAGDWFIDITSDQFHGGDTVRAWHVSEHEKGYAGAYPEYAGFHRSASSEDIADRMNLSKSSQAVANQLKAYQHGPALLRPKKSHSENG